MKRLLRYVSAAKISDYLSEEQLHWAVMDLENRIDYIKVVTGYTELDDMCVEVRMVDNEDILINKYFKFIRNSELEWEVVEVDEEGKAVSEAFDIKIF